MSPRDPLRRIFSADVLGRLANAQRPEPSKWDSDGKPIRERHIVIRTTGPEPSPARWAHHRAWKSYLRAADACGLLGSAEVLSRLAGTDDDGFRSAMAECCVAWYFARRRRARVAPNSASKAKKNFDFVIERNGLNVNTEVKAPCVPRSSRSWSGEDSQVLRKGIEHAGTQLTKGQPNIVVFVPLLRSPVYTDRHQLLKATIGEPALNVFVSLDGSEPPRPEPTFLQKGKLAKLWAAGGGAFRTDLTRVSAVMTIEHRRDDGPSGPRLSPIVVVIHNPFADKPVAPSFFGRVPQLTVRNGRMRWSDGYTGP